MTRLNEAHIAYIRKDLHVRGVILDEFEDEVIDHFSSAIEAEMDLGKNFIEAHRATLKRFGYTDGLRQTQHKIIQSTRNSSPLMLSSYLKIALRNLSKHRFFSAVNIVGLAIGIAACLTIALYIQHEFSYDRHFTHADRIYRMNSEMLINGNAFHMASTPAAAARVMLADYPEVEAAMHFHQRPWRWVRRDEVSFKEQYIAYASKEIFKIFSLVLLEGDTATALKEPNTIIISRTRAEKYFPREKAVGQTLVIDNTNYAITGVFDDLPVTTHFRFDFILSAAGDEESKDDGWLTNNFNTYLLLREGTSAKELESKLPMLVEKYFGPQARTFLGNDVSLNTSADGDKVVYSLTPVTDIHLHSHLTMEMGTNSDITYVYLFGAIAVFILVVACINFMNLSTARSFNRAKEVGVRKAMGSVRSHLIRQFLTESVLLSAFSFALALGIAYLLMPLFNTLAERSLEIPFSSPVFILVIAAGAIGVGFLAGLYPSFFLSAFKPAQVLKGKVTGGMKSGNIRSALVVLQFMISIFLVTGTIAVHKQMIYIQEKNLGYAKDQVIVLHNTETLGSQLQPFKHALQSNTLVVNATVSGYVPIAGWARFDRGFWKAGEVLTAGNHVVMQCWNVDHDYVPTMGMKMRAGRNFSLEFPGDSTAVVINESAARHFGFKDPIGERLETFAFLENAFDEKRRVIVTIVGVVEDFHFESLKDNITPLCLRLGASNWSMPVRFQPARTTEVVSFLERTWKQFSPDKPFEFSFLDDAFGTMYASERRLERVFGIFATLAIAIACLGLFALTAFTAEQRTKEIGIRKVLGASVGSIVYLLSREFGKLISIAFALSAPLAWLAIDWWLDAYQYKVAIGIWVYASAGLFAFVVAWLTMSFQSVKAAITNPINSLRSE